VIGESKTDVYADLLSSRFPSESALLQSPLPGTQTMPHLIATFK
jgi:hypothetical protein